MHFGRRGWVKSPMNYTVKWDGVGVSYSGIQCLVAAGSVRVCSTIAPGGVWSRSKVWQREARRGLRIPLPEHADRSLLQHPKKYESKP
jgi:hypothetical protein